MLGSLWIAAYRTSRLVRRPKHVAQQAAPRSGRPFDGKTACVDEGRLTMARLRCRLPGQHVVLQEEGISILLPEAGHEHDVFYECSRCRAGEWRPLDLSWSGVPRRSSGRRRQRESARALLRPTATALSTAPMASRLASRPRMPSGRLTCPSPCPDVSRRGRLAFMRCRAAPAARTLSVRWTGEAASASRQRLGSRVWGEICVWVQTPAAAPAGAATVEAIAAERSAVASVVGGCAEGLPTPWVMPTRASGSATSRSTVERVQGVAQAQVASAIRSARGGGA